MTGLFQSSPLDIIIRSPRQVTYFTHEWDLFTFLDTIWKRPMAYKVSSEKRKQR